MDDPAWESLINEVLRTGPADGQDILEHLKTHDLWETLYTASRSSPYAAIWREAFGRERINHVHPRSILLLAGQALIDTCNTPSADHQYELALLLSKFIANCCAENANARRTVIKAGVLKPLLDMLRKGLDPNLLIPSVYNVCTELEDERDIVLTDLTIDYRNVTLYDVELRLARCDQHDGSVYNGLYTFMRPEVIVNISDDILEYFAELLDMVAKSIAVAQSGHIPTYDQDFGQALALMLNPESGRRLASRSQLCHNAVSRALLSITISAEAQSFVATQGLILDITLMPEPYIQKEGDQTETEEYDGTRVHIRAVRDHQKASFQRLTYSIAQSPQFEENMSYGIARQALRIINRTKNAYENSIAYIMLYMFVNSEQRAHLLINEGLLQPLFATLESETDIQAVHPASALLAKCSSMWSLKARLAQENTLQVVRRLLLASNLGYEIPSTAVVIIELLIKGHPNHIEMLLQKGLESTVLDDVFSLFNKGNQSICLDVGRLVVEILATLANSKAESSDGHLMDLNWFAGACPKDSLVKVLTLMAKNADREDVGANRVWYALGLLVVTETGFDITRAVVQNPEILSKMKEIENKGGPLAENVKFVNVHLSDVSRRGQQGSLHALDQTMQQMSLG